MASKWPWLIFTMLSYPPPNSTCPHTDMHTQTDGDYTKRVVTPFGTTRLKTVKCLTNELSEKEVSRPPSVLSMVGPNKHLKFPCAVSTRVFDAPFCSKVEHQKWGLVWYIGMRLKLFQWDLIVGVCLFLGRDFYTGEYGGWLHGIPKVCLYFGVVFFTLFQVPNHTQNRPSSCNVDTAIWTGISRVKSPLNKKAGA